MESIEKWTEQIVKPNPPNTNAVQHCVFTPDGYVLFAVVSDILIAFNAETGDSMIKPIKAAKEIINCIAFAKDGRMLATGSNDKSCVVWKFNLVGEKKIEPILKFSQADAILCLTFNPLTQELFSGSGTDFALYNPEKTDIPKEKYKERIISAAWSPDGQTLAFGTLNGTISFRERNLTEKAEVNRTAPIWCMQWTPITSEHQESYLLVGCWDNTFSLYQSDGSPKERVAERRIPCNPTTIDFHHSGEYFVMAGTNKKLSIWTRDLNYLGDVMDLNDWSWKSCFRPKSNTIGITTNDGIITVRELSKKPIFSSYKEIFGSRDNLTDVVVQNLLINQKLRLKCRELVKLIALYEDKLAVLQTQRLLIYVSASESLEYKPYRKISRKFDCDFFDITSNHALFAKDRKIQLYSLTGELEKEWVLESEVTYMCTVGGPAKREHILVGQKSGEVLKIFINNSFPISLYKSSSAVTGCSLNLNKKRLAVIDLNNTMVIYDLVTQVQLHQENGINSCVWNADLEDTIAYTGMGQLFIKTGNMPAFSQKTEAKVLGFNGFQLFVLKDDKITLMDVSQTSTLVKFIQKKDFKMAYKLASLGIADNDIRMLGIEALQNGEFAIAEKCFVKLKDLPFIELTRKYAEDKVEGKLNDTFLKAQVLAYQGKYQEAADLYMKAAAPYQAAQLYVDLRRFDDAKRVIQIRGNDTSEKKMHLADIQSKQAEWLIQNNDPKQAIQLYIRSRNYKKAMTILTKMENYEGLAELCREMDKNEHEQYLTICASLFKKNKLYDYAKEAFLKLGDHKSLLALYIQAEKWEDAFRIGKQYKDLLDLVKLPYANYLMRVDEYEKALEAYQLLGRADLTRSMLNTLASNASAQKRFLDSARHSYTLAKESLKMIKDLRNRSKEDEEIFVRYEQLKVVSEIYYAYNTIHTFVESPFFTSSESALYTILNACRFIICKLNKRKLPFINLNYVYYSLAKVAKMLEGYKTARTCYEKLMELQIPKKWVEEIDLGSLLMRSKPYTDNENILPICNRCLMTNPVISEKDSCFSCKHPFVISFSSFEVLPLVEFQVEPGLTHAKVMELLNSQKPDNLKGRKMSQKINDGWNETKTDKQQVLSLKHGGKTEEIMNTPFYEKMAQAVQQQQTSLEYQPIVLKAETVATLQIDSVYVQDMRKTNPTANIRYYKNLVSELLIKSCQQCGKFFSLDEYEFQYVQHKHCPFCNKEDKRTGPSRSVFDL